MAIVITLSPELKALLHDRAVQRGQDVAEKQRHKYNLPTNS
jgi:hypothetical protein